MRRALVPVLLGALAGLLPLASAIPPDPIWIPGFYDGADYDDVVGLVFSEDSEQTEILAALGRPSEIVGLQLGSLPDWFRAVAFASTLRLRSPPTV